MKSLLILRHAKTEASSPRGDHARELTDRGRRDATTIGRYIAASIGAPDAIVTSDASRALATAELVAAACHFAGELTVEPGIYGAGAEALAGIIRRFPDAAACVVLVGHNPGMTNLVALMTRDSAAIEHLPTAGLVRLEHDTDHWAEVTPGSCRFRDMITPKMLAEEG